MTLRTRTSSPSRAGGTSGPGRPRRSDGRLRDRRRQPYPDPATVRRRAEAILTAPPPEPPPDPLSDPPPGVRVRVPDAVAGPEPVVGAEAAPPDGRGSRWLAVRERLPVWVQARCGVEPRTVAALAVVLVAGVGFAAQQYWSARPGPVTAPAVVAPASVPAPAPGPSAPAPTGGNRVVVDVSGKVREPGVRTLPAGARVEDALAAAGGVRPGTDMTGLNRARVLVDGEQVVVGAPAQPPAGGGGPGSGSGSGGGPLSLGSATVAQLDGLPGVGPVLAQHIVDFRTARGGFRSVEELRQVNGIGERRFSDLRKLVRP
ncbi:MULTISPECIES: helix-hairpin-helix domain-containing protein [unclassified Streptomyces]|uniref:helix-hairpin-helix domain-containing protein n=1 Tax=unclassified Streptomyces TaxID=2593676 RepID=UPI002E3613EA|nr:MULTISPECIES: helix-hairpin-helix domain-containing protein [unclassified Streptomyces]